MRRLVLAALVLAVVPVPARAADQRPCVSKVEFDGAKRWSRAETEARWEVTGLGDVISWRHHGRNILVAYPYCGRPNLTVQVEYDRNVQGRYMSFTEALVQG